MDTQFLSFPIIAFISYLLGSISFGLIFTKLAGHGDIRKVGSGNIGATNVLRTGNKLLAFATLIFDAGKGSVAVLLAGNYGNDAMNVAAVAVLIGHIFPVWLNFAGGKGVATGAGIYIAMSWPVAACALGAWVFTAVITRYSSLAALVAVGLSPVIAFLLEPSLISTTALLALLIIYRHRENIERLLAGTEDKIGTSGNKKK